MQNTVKQKTGDRNGLVLIMIRHDAGHLSQGLFFSFRQETGVQGKY
jgi:hypothetical protein